MGMPHYRRKLAPDTLRVLAHTAIASYAQLGADITNPRQASLLILTNSMDVAAQISLDGTNEHFRLLPGVSLTLSMTQLEGYFEKADDVVLEVYAKRLATSAEGNVTLSVVK